MVRLPDFVTEQHVETAKIAAIKRTQAAQGVNVEILNEGKCMQILHLGPYSREPKTLEKLDSFIETEGLKRNGLHHEIYLTDPRKSTPEKLRTILRQPVR